MMQTRTRALSDMFIKVEYGLHTIGNQSPYFTVTGSIWNNRAHYRRWPDNAHTGGMIHDEVLRAFPDLADIVALHLSDIDGVPMHAIANGEYFYRQGEIDKAANLLRVPVEEMPAGLSPEEFAQFANAQRDRWKAEAVAAIQKYNLS